MSSPSAGDAAVHVEADGASVGAAKWAAMKQLERRFPGIEVDHVEFEVLEERPASAEAEGYARVAASADVGAWRETEREFSWPEEPAERVRDIVRRTIAFLGIRASVDIEESADEVRA